MGRCPRGPPAALPPPLSASLGSCAALRAPVLGRLRCTRAAGSSALAGFEAGEGDRETRLELPGILRSPPPPSTTDHGGWGWRGLKDTPQRAWWGTQLRASPAGVILKCACLLR